MCVQRDGVRRRGTTRVTLAPSDTDAVRLMAALLGRARLEGVAGRDGPGPAQPEPNRCPSFPIPRRSSSRPPASAPTATCCRCRLAARRRCGEGRRRAARPRACRGAGRAERRKADAPQHRLAQVDDGRGVLLLITDAGRDALGIGPLAPRGGAAAAPGGDAAKRRRRARVRPPQEPRSDAGAAPDPRGTKQAALVGLLGRAEGAHHRRDRRGDRLAAAHGARRLRRGTEEAARADGRVGEGRGARPGLPDRPLRLPRPPSLCQGGGRLFLFTNVCRHPCERPAHPRYSRRWLGCAHVVPVRARGCAPPLHATSSCSSASHGSRPRRWSGIMAARA